MPAERMKRARGNYAKLICLQCRDRRIKCLLPEDIEIQASSDPQPRETSCQRCCQKGLDCIVRKTTLGRPNRKWGPDDAAATTSGGTTTGGSGPGPVPTSASIAPSDTPRSESLSPDIDELVLCNPEDLPHDENTDRRSPDVVFRERSYSADGRPTGQSLAYAMDLTFDRTLALLGQDDNFGRGLADLEQKPIPPSLLTVVDEDLASTLDPHLVWVRMYLPHIPSLPSLRSSISRSELDRGAALAAESLLALLCSIALETPVELSSTARQSQDALRSITYHSGRQLLFALPRHAYTLMFLELIHSYRPLALISGREPAAHALTGKLYTTLGKMLALQLGLHHSASRLRDILDGRTVAGGADTRKCVLDSMQWSWWLMSEPRVHGELKSTNPAVHEPEVALEQALAVVSEAFERNIAPSDALIAFCDLRHEADDLYVMRCLTKDWNRLEALKSHITTREQLSNRRQQGFEKYLTQLFPNKATSSEATALAQLSNMQLNVGRTDAMGLALFYAIMSGTTSNASNAGRRIPPPTGPFSRYFVECLSQHSPYDEWSPVGSFLEQFGDVQVDGLEKRLAAFISVASELRLQGTPFMAPPRKICCNIVFSCKEIVENSAVRLRLSQELHHRIDVHLILFMEAARCLENMEHNGGSAEALGRGSVPTACAKVVRSLHRIVLQWRRNYANREIKATAAPLLPSNPATAASTMEVSAARAAFGPQPNYAASNLDWDALLNDDLFADWDNWAQLGAVDLGQDMELNGMN